MYTYRRKRDKYFVMYTFLYSDPLLQNVITFDLKVTAMEYVCM